MFGLHETPRGSSYVPPTSSCISHNCLKRYHFTFLPERFLRLYFAATALALAVSTCTGIMVSWKYAHRKSTVLLTLGAEVLIPAILVFM